MPDYTLKNDLLLRAARRERTERTPAWLMRQAGRFDPEYLALRERAGLPLEELFAHPDLATEISLLPKRLGVDAIIFFQDILTILTPMGRPFVFRPGPVLSAPIRSAADVDQVLGLDPAVDVPFVGQTLRQVRETLGGDIPLLGFAGAPFTLAAFAIEGRSPTQSCTHVPGFLRAEPAAVHRLLAKLADATADYLAYQVESGAQAVQLFESCADLLSPAQYAEFAHPYQQRVFARMGDRVPRILFARRGDVTDLMVDSGADVISLTSDNDLAQAKQRFGARVALQGNVDNQLLCDGPIEAIEQAVRHCIDAGGHQGHILNLGHGILKDTPFDHVCRMIDMAQAYRVAAGGPARASDSAHASP